MPTSRRTSSIFLRSSVSSMPSTTMLPLLVFLEPVDAADQRRFAASPTGPQITMRSPRLTAEVDVAQHVELAEPFVQAGQSRPRSRVRVGRSSRIVDGARCAMLVDIAPSMPPSACAGVQAPLDEQRIARHAEAEHEVDHAGKRKAGEQRHRRRPVRIGEGGAQLAEQIEDRHDQHQRRVLEQADEGIDDAGNDELQRLRQDDEPHHPPVAEAERHGAFVLAARDRLQPAAHHLRHVGRREQRHADQRAQQARRCVQSVGRNSGSM